MRRFIVLLIVTACILLPISSVYGETLTDNTSFSYREVKELYEKANKTQETQSKIIYLTHT